MRPIHHFSGGAIDSCPRFDVDGIEAGDEQPPRIPGKLPEIFIIDVDKTEPEWSLKLSDALCTCEMRQA